MGNRDRVLLFQKVDSLQQVFCFVRPSLVHAAKQGGGRSVEFLGILRRHAIVEGLDSVEFGKAGLNQLRGQPGRAL